MNGQPISAARSRVLVIQTAFLGDVVLTTPLLSASPNSMDRWMWSRLRPP